MDNKLNQNSSMPMPPSRLEAARARLNPGTVAGGARHADSGGGKGSRREVRKGEWIDDRVIVIDGPASPSKDTPPELPKPKSAPPSSYDATKVYKIILFKTTNFAGRALAPGKEYTMAGYAATEVADAVIDAVEIGPIPAPPDAGPSGAKADTKATKHKG